jgi:hypothetical protein
MSDLEWTGDGYSRWVAAPYLITTFHSGKVDRGLISYRVQCYAANGWDMHVVGIGATFTEAKVLAQADADHDKRKGG